MFVFEFLVQPALVGIYVLIKDVIYDEYTPENPHVLIDIASNVFAKLVSGFVTVELLVPYTTPMASWLEPLFHGAINGGIKHQFVDTDNLNAASFVRSGFQFVSGQRKRVVPPIHHYTFENGFLEGLGFNLAARLTTMPLEWIF